MFGEDQLEISADRRQGVVQFVGDPGDHLAESREFLRLPQLLFKPRLVGEVAEEELVGGLLVQLDFRADDADLPGPALAVAHIHDPPVEEQSEPVRASGGRRIGLPDV